MMKWFGSMMDLLQYHHFYYTLFVRAFHFVLIPEVEI